jgi:hypothetical protein
MKNKYLLLLLVALSCCYQKLQAQTIANDTINYNGIKYYPGRLVQMFFGSGKNGEFSYAFVGGRSRIIKDPKKTDLYPLSAHFAKSKIKIDKVYFLNGICYARGALLDRPTGEGFDDHYIYIDVKGAVDSREVWEDSLR